jgi:hypothetical protein
MATEHLYGDVVVVDPDQDWLGIYESDDSGDWLLRWEGHRVDLGLEDFYIMTRHADVEFVSDGGLREGRRFIERVADWKMESVRYWGVR